jgi:hypothetical protein
MPPGAGSTGRGKVEERLPPEPAVAEIVCAVPPGLYCEKIMLKILIMRKLFQRAATEGAQGNATT